MQGSSKGIACSFSGFGDGDEHAANWHDFSEAVANVDRLERLNATQRGRSWSLPVPEGAGARIPMVTSRVHWLDQVRATLATDRGRVVRKAQDVSWKFVVAVAVAMALFSTSSTGRDVTASNEALARRAGVSARAVRRARKVLAELGLAVEVVRGRNRLTRFERMLAEAHHGGVQRRAASVWFLSSPREVAQLPRRASASPIPRSRPAKAALAYPQLSSTGHLPPSGGFSSSSCVSKISPKSTKSCSAQKAAHRTKTDNPRPLHLLKAAAVLVGRSGIDRGRWIRLEDGRHLHNPWLRPGCGHLGAVADAIVAAGIDTARWLGHEIEDRLNRDNKDRGWSTPDRIRQPIAYLRTRLAALDWSGPSPSELAAAARARTRADVERRRAEYLRRPVGAVPHDAPSRRAAREAAKSRGVHKHPLRTSAVAKFAPVRAAPRTHAATCLPAGASEVLNRKALRRNVMRPGARPFNHHESAYVARSQGVQGPNDRSAASRRLARMEGPAITAGHGINSTARETAQRHGSPPD